MVNIVPCLNVNRTIYFTGRRACYHAIRLSFSVKPHLVKLLMFYAIKIQFILANNTAGGVRRVRRLNCGQSHRLENI